MSNPLHTAFDTMIGVNWLEIIKTLAPVATVFIAFTALRSWQHQDKAKREADFLDALIEAAHSYIVEMPKPITILEMAKIGMESHAPTWEIGEQADIAVKGAIAYIQKNGERDARRLWEALETVQPSVIKLRSLAAKGQIFNFDGYAKCWNAVVMLTSQFGRIEAFTGFVGSPAWNWEHPEVLKRLKEIMAINPDEIRDSLQKCNAVLLEFVSATYGRVYGGMNRRHFFWRGIARRRDTKRRR